MSRFTVSIVCAAGSAVPAGALALNCYIWNLTTINFLFFSLLGVAVGAASWLLCTTVSAAVDVSVRVQLLLTVGVAIFTSLLVSYALTSWIASV